MALEIVVPMVAGLAVLWLARRTPSRFPNPARTSLILLVLVVVTAGLLGPGRDVITPVIGWIVSAVVCAGVFVEVRRRRVEAT